MRDVMIDLETLSTRPDAMVVAIGAVTFGSDGIGEEFYATVSHDTAAGHIDAATVAWWMGQSGPARTAAFQGGAPLSFVLGELTRFIPCAGEHTRVWGHGSSFDIPIIESAYRAAGQRAPWGHRAARDTRTILDLAGIRVEIEEAERHNALSDARAHARAVIRAVSILGHDRHHLGEDRFWRVGA